MQTALMLMIIVSLAMITYYLLTNDDSLEYFDRVEVNHVYDHFGDERLVQIIFWDVTRSGLHVRDWRHLRHDHVPVKVDGLWHIYWWDEKDKRARTSISKTYLETHTNYDREVVNRDVLPLDRRRPLK